MPQVMIYDKVVTYQFDASVTDPARQQAAADALAAMSTLVTALESPDLETIFNLIDSVMFFEDDILSGDFVMDRSFTDLPSRQFNWKLAEFLDPNHTPCSRATYYYHDAFHVSQFNDAGEYPTDIDTQAQWEVDAIDAQIGAANRLACDQYLIDFLNDFDHSQPQIVARLEAGVRVACVGAVAGAALPV